MLKTINGKRLSSYKHKHFFLKKGKIIVVKKVKVEWFWYTIPKKIQSGKKRKIRIE